MNLFKKHFSKKFCWQHEKLFFKMSSMILHKLFGCLPTQVVISVIDIYIINFLKKYMKSALIKSVVSTSKAKAKTEIETNDHSHSRHRCLPLDQVHCSGSVTNSALYVDKAGYGSNGKIVPAKILLLAAKQTLPIWFHA